MDLREIGWGSVEWIQLAQDRDRCRAVVPLKIFMCVYKPTVIMYGYDELVLCERQVSSLYRMFHLKLPQQQ
jgi:hypothetical protein